MLFLALILAPAFMALLAAHKIVAGVIAWAILAAVVDGMPAPSADSGVAYKWAYASLNAAAMNIFRLLCSLSPKFAAFFASKSA